MNRTTLSLGVVVAALAAIYGVATVATPAPAAPTSAPGTQSVASTAERKPIQRSTLVCPGPTGNDYTSSAFTAYTPPGTGPAATGGSAHLTPVDQDAGFGDSLNKAPAHPKPVLPLKAPGTPATVDTTNRDTYPLVGSADGPFAPGWTVQETNTIMEGGSLGLLGTACGETGTDFWFPGASTVAQDYVDLTNPDPTAAVVQIDLYDAKGQVKTVEDGAITVPGNSSVPVLLSTLSTQGKEADVTVHVTVHTGRVGAAVQVLAANGSDWLPASAAPADSVVLPGIPGDASAVHLVGYATTGNEAAVRLKLLTRDGAITPATSDAILKPGVTTAIDLKNLTQGEPGSLLITPADPTQTAPFVAALQITRTHSHSQDIAFIPGTAPLGFRATAADNTSVSSSPVTLTATTAAATVKITSSATTKGGTAASTTVTVEGGTIQQFTPPDPHGSGTFAITVETVSGGPVYATRELTANVAGVPGFTIQTLPDDGGYVQVPQAFQDLSALEP